MLPVVTKGKPVVLQVYCRVEVVIDDPAAVTELAVRRLRDANIDWSREQDTVEDAAAELRADLVQALASVVDPDRMLDGVPGAEIRRGRWWAERGGPSARFQPGFTESGSDGRRRT
ncbi:hypothetical protein ABT297_42470 [Dactylosporangium sp. NPDC000555]|uniref:hypothetical protein n=1 Tax=Dactylosporangium sp. NPDC000555 TaxID=3154260 RepID=UPI00332B39BE